MEDDHPTSAIRHARPEERLEELSIALQAAHEVNAHLNGEVERLTTRVTELEGERDGYRQRVHVLSKKLAHARQQAGADAAPGPGEAGPGDGGVPGEEDVSAPGTDGDGWAGPTGSLPPDSPWLPDAAWQATVALAREQGWLIDAEEVVLGPVLGRGTFGTTHRATWRGAEVAVKCVRVRDAGGAAMLLRELEALRRVRHPNALEQAHPPVLHRDLKPSNVFLDAHGAAKVADMGLARVLMPGEAAYLTGETGTYMYLSPENIQHQPYGMPSDVWSWGVLAVELLTQRRPYAALHLTPVQIAVEVGAGSLRPLLPPDCPPAMADLLEGVFSADPMERPSFGIIVGCMARVVADEEAGTAQARRAGEWLAGRNWGLPTKLQGMLKQ